MQKFKITRQQARRFILAHQGLNPPGGLKGKAGILSHIRRVGCIQFDPLNIVGHNQELVLQARIADFRPAMLQELLYKERRLLDGWDKMMSIYCTEDWPYFSRYRQSSLQELGSSSKPIAAILPQVRKELEERGPLSSIELGFDHAVDWPWAPTRASRAALESMYFWGELIIHHKVHTRKVYDFAYKHLPKELISSPDPNRTEQEYRDWHVHRRIGGIGLLWGRSGDAWLAIPGVKSGERAASINRLLERGRLAVVDVEGISAPLYIRSEDVPGLEQALAVEESRPRASVLAPLDNLLWDRKLLSELFGFDYRWEVYKPRADRDFGYYVLPVLYGDKFIARFEPGRDKKNKALIIKNWWWEPGVKPVKAMQRELAACFRRFLKFLNAERITASDSLCGPEFKWLRL
jgi:uncharacterized protein YcaQ